MPPYDPSRRSADPSGWIRRFAHLVPPHARLLDLACGGGRHGRFFLDRQALVTFVDLDVSGLGDLEGSAEILAHDLEKAGWPFAGRQFDAIVVVNYLHRPLAEPLLSALAPGGTFLYETFAAGNERYDRPRNPDHLLGRSELLDLVGAHLQIVAYEDGIDNRPSGCRVIQRICARADREPAFLSA